MDPVKTHLFINTPQGVNRVNFVAMYYRPGMTMEEAKLLIATHPEIAPLKLRDCVRTHLYVEAPRGFRGDDFVAMYYRPGMTMEDARELILTHPEIAPLKLRDRVRTHLYINTPLGLHHYNDEFVAKYYRPGMTMQEAEHLIETHPIMVIMFNINYHPDVIYDMHRPMSPFTVYRILSSYYVEGISENELSNLSFADQTVQWRPSLHNTFTHTCNSMVITFLLCIQRNVFTGDLPYIPEDIIFEILSNFRRQDFIAH